MALRAQQLRRWQKIATDRRRPTAGKIVIVERPKAEPPKGRAK